MVFDKERVQGATMLREWDTVRERAAVAVRQRQRWRRYVLGAVFLGTMFAVVAGNFIFVYLGSPEDKFPLSLSGLTQVEVPAISEHDFGKGWASLFATRDAELATHDVLSGASNPPDPPPDSTGTVARGLSYEPTPEPNKPAGQSQAESLASLSAPREPASTVPEPTPMTEPPLLDQARASPAHEPVEPTASSLDPRVSRAQLTSGVREREPVDQLDSPITLNGRQDRRILYFTELRDLAGQTVVHRWMHEGKVVAIVPFAIAGERWRVYSRKPVVPDQSGAWRVVITDATGAELASKSFVVEEW